MAGGLLQIITYGTEDLSLTGNPQITFFHSVYRRYTNFGKKVVELSFNNSPNFNATSYINIPKNNGDLLSKSILKIKLPTIDLTYLNEAVSTLSNAFNETNNTDDYLISYITSGVPYYNYFLNYYNNLKNIVNIFFQNYDGLYNNLSYIQDLKNFILKYINNDQINQFFNSINYFYNKSGNVLTKYNIDLYTNASLFLLNNYDLIYVYDKLTSNDISYEGFKFAIHANMEILAELNINIYNLLKNNVNNSTNIKFCWVNKIAMYLFNSIDFYIGSNKIYSLSDTYINNYSELYYKNKKIYNDLIGNDSSINVFSTLINESILYLPIPFWNLSNYGLAFPLISLQFNSLQIKINTKRLIDCIRIDTGLNNRKINNDIVNLINNNIDKIVKSNLEITLLLEYIYLDRIERNKFARSAHEYLIEQVQQIEFNKISPSNNTIQLEIFHCCKDMYWFVQKIASPLDLFSKNREVFSYVYPFKSLDNLNINPNKIYFINYCSMLYNPSTLYDPFVFNQGIYIINNNLKYLEQLNILIQYVSNKFIFSSFFAPLNTIVLASNFYLNSTQLFSETFNYFNYLQPYACYNSTPQLGLNVYSFCLSPTEFQPTGACNMSRISYIGLKLKINNKINDTLISEFILDGIENSTDEYKLTFQTRNFNILRIIGGIGATAYTYN